MSDTQPSTASRQELWRARDYANRQDDSTRPDYLEGLRWVRLRPGTTLLDLGCGAGGFCRMAADAGALVTGIDSSAGMVEVARERVPEGMFQLGDTQVLSFDTDAFDVVTAFNSLQFTADPQASLVEARRVAKPGATVFIVVFGRAEHVGQIAGWRALASLIPPRRSTSPGPLSLSKPGLLDKLVQASGLCVTNAGYLEGRFDYPDQAAMLRGQRTGQVAVLGERVAGEAVVTDALVRAYAPYRTSSGGYRIDFEWRYVLALA
ncbi:MAG: class I SAM-dependent methyltransferase [Solirubrobacterales bacterium]|nr:class I SAM-dependent methyltransferase [Solirubrobacterales bacterium]